MMAWLVTCIFLIVTYWLAKKDIIWGVAWLCFWVTSYLVRMEVLGIPTTALELSIYLIFALYLGKVWKGRAKWRWATSNWWVLAWVVVGLISAVIVSDHKVSSLGLWKGWFVDPAVLYLIVINNLKYKGQVKLIYLAFVFLLGTMGFLAIWQWATGTAITDDGRISTFFSSANYLAMLVEPVLLFVLAKFLVEKRCRWWEMVFWVMGLLALILSASYVGLMSFVLGCLFLTWMIYTKNIKSFLLVVLAGIVLAGVFVSLQPDQSRLQRMIDLSERSSVTVRLEVWQTAIYMIKNTGFWGVGLGNFEEKYLEYAPQIFHPPMEWKMLHAHNLYLHTWLSVTLAGLIILLIILLWWWTKAIKFLKQREYFWLYAGLAILLAWAVGGLADTPYYKNDLAFLFWLILALIMASQNVQKTEVKILNKKDGVKSHG